MLNSFGKFWKTLSLIDRGLFGFLWLVISILILHGSLSLYFYNFYQTPSVTWSEQQYKVIPNIIKKGDPIIFYINQRCSKDTYRVSINREIIDSISYTIPQSNVTFKKGCIRDVRFVPNVTAVLPTSSDYYLSNNIEVTIRWLYFSRIDKYSTMTERFTIIK